MKVKDLYWAARNSTFFINLESEGRPLLCEPRLSDEGGVRIRLWLRNLAEGTGAGGAMSLLFALSDVLQLFLVGGCWAAPSGHDVRFEDAAGRWVYEGQLRADTVRHGVIPDRSNHQERHEILRVESFDGDVKAVQSFLNEHDAGYIAEVTPEQPIIVEALGNKACVYVTKIVQCELRDVLRLLEAK